MLTLLCIALPSPFHLIISSKPIQSYRLHMDKFEPDFFPWNRLLNITMQEKFINVTAQTSHKLAKIGICAVNNEIEITRNTFPISANRFQYVTLYTVSQCSCCVYFVILYLFLYRAVVDNSHKWKGWWKEIILNYIPYPEFQAHIHTHTHTRITKMLKRFSPNGRSLRIRGRQLPF